jgi:hypothetical protein
MPTVEYERPDGQTDRITGRYADTDERGEFVVVLTEEENGTRKTRVPLHRVICIEDGLTNND